MPNNDFDPLFEAAGKHYNVDPQLLKTIFHIESGGNANAKNGAAGEIGPMQFMPKTAKAMNLQDPTDMLQAIPAAAQIIRKGLDDNNGDVAAALRTYNGGTGGVNNPQTIDYVMRAQKLYSQMKVGSSPAASPAPATTNSFDIGDSIINGNIPTNSSSAGKSSSFDLGDSIINSQTGGASAIPSETKAPATIAPQVPTTPGPAAMPPGASPALDMISPDISANPITTGIRNALQPGPNDYQMHGLGRLLPIAHDEATGQNRLAFPQAIQQLGNGALDLMEGPRTGTVTPDARAVLLGAALAGKTTPSPASSVVGKIPSPPEGPVDISPEFRANPFSNEYNAARDLPLFSHQSGPTSPNPHLPPGGRSPPNENPSSPETQQFSDMVKQAIIDHLKNTGSSYIGKAVKGAIVGHGIGGPMGAAIGAVVNPLISHLSPKVQAAVMANLKDYAIPQSIIGGPLSGVTNDLDGGNAGTGNLLERQD